MRTGTEGARWKDLMGAMRVVKFFAIGAVMGLALGAASNAHAFLSWSATVNGVDACAVDNDAVTCTHGTVISDANPLPGTLTFTDVIANVLFDTVNIVSVKGPPLNSLSSFYGLILSLAGE